MSGKIFIPIVTGFDRSGIDQAQSSLGKLAGSIKGVVGNLGSMGSVLSQIGITKFISDSVESARDLQRNFVALDTIFGQYGQKMKNFAKDSAAFGLSSVDSAKASVFLGSVLKQSGFEMGQVSSETEKLVRLAADLATTYGYDVSEALTGMTALFRGEYDPIEKFGVAMKQAEVNALLLAKGQKGLTGAELRHAQAVARLELLYQRAGDAMGAFANQGDSLFASQKRLSATFENMQASLGQSIIGPLTSVVNGFQSVLQLLEPSFRDFYKIVGRVLDGFNAMLPTLGRIAKSFMDVINPIIDMFASAITSLVPTFDALWYVIKPIVDLFAGILEFVNMIVKWISVLVKIIGIVLLGLGKIIEWITGGAIKSGGTALVNMFKAGSFEADKLNAQLDEVIANMTEIQTNAVSNVATDPNSIAPYLPGQGNPDLKNNSLADWLMTGVMTATKAMSEWTDQQKQQFKDLQASVRATLVNLIPGSLIAREMGAFEKAVVSTYEGVSKQLSQAVSNGILSKGAANALLKYAKTELDTLGRLARKRDELAKKYSLAKTLMDDIKKTTIGFANLSDIMGKLTSDITETVTYVVDKFTISVSKSTKSLTSAKQIIDQYRDIVGRTKSFVADMQKLQSLDLNKTLFQQIVNAGLDSGSAIASALASGGATAVNELNSLYTELSSLGGSLGETTAEVMYGAGIDASDGLLKGILSADQKFKDAAKALAKSFADEFNAGVSARSGSGLTVNTAGAENVLKTASVNNATRFGSTVNVTVNAGIGTDGASVGREIVTAIKKYERVSGRVFATAV